MSELKRTEIKIDRPIDEYIRKTLLNLEEMKQTFMDDDLQGYAAVIQNAINIIRADKDEIHRLNVELECLRRIKQCSI